LPAADQPPLSISPFPSLPPGGNAPAIFPIFSPLFSRHAQYFVCGKYIFALYEELVNFEDIKKHELLFDIL
jgi:hypothetical protein